MKIRTGKNIYFTLTVFRLDNTPEDFTDARNIRMVINRKYSNYQFEPQLTIIDNVISFEFPASPLATPGRYEMHLSYDKLNDQSVTGKDTYYLDYCEAFKIVSSTCEEDTETLAEVPTISLKGVISRNMDGKDGVTPHIDPETKHWMIGSEDTGVVAEAKDGLTPYIGGNGNWFIGDTDTGKPSRGKAFEYSDFTIEQIEELQRPASDTIDDLTELGVTLTENEQQRTENEQERKNAEQLRDRSETQRLEAENTRNSKEETRQTAESYRNMTESERAGSEVQRVLAESARDSNEDARKIAETNRETAESGRADAETKRVAAESARVNEFTELKTESEAATQNARDQADYAREQGDKVGSTMSDFNSALSVHGNRALYIAAGAVYNETTGFYELNGLTDITEDEMRTIYTETNSMDLIADMNGAFAMCKFRTNLGFERDVVQNNSKSFKFVYSFSNNNKLEVLRLSLRDTSTIEVNLFMGALHGCSRLRSVIGIFDVIGITVPNGFLNSFNYCANLRDIKLRGLRIPLSIPYSPLLSLESLQYLINNAANASTITVTLHPDVYNKIQDETNTEWHALLAAAQDKNIILATV